MVRFTWILCTMGIISNIHAVDYCAITCNGVMHTMCYYPIGGGPNCSNFVGGLTREEQMMIVDLHNELRQKVALGNERRGFQPNSSNMMEMFYNEELALVAQRWAHQCDVRAHDRCRVIPGFDYVGQNIGWISGWDTSGAVRLRNDAVRDIVMAWYDEVGNMTVDVKNFNPTPKDAPLIGHYTQMVWAHTYFIGCGFVQFVTETVYEYRLVCNYAPGGNYKKEEIYEIGPPCSNCPKGTTCSQRWAGLCVFDYMNQVLSIDKKVQVHLLPRPDRNDNDMVHSKKENADYSEKESEEYDEDYDEDDFGDDYDDVLSYKYDGEFDNHTRNGVKQIAEEEPFPKFSYYHSSSARSSCDFFSIVTFSFVLFNVL